MATHTYDPGKVSIMVAGVEITGYADGTFIEVARAEPLSKTVVSADGSEVTRVKSRNKSGTLTLTLLATSDANAFLDALRQTDEQGQNAVVPIAMDDGNNTEIFSAEAWIEELPGYGYAKDAGTRAWKFGLANVNFVVTPGTTAWQAAKNLVGSLIEDIF